MNFESSSERGSVSVEFLAASAGALAITGATLLTLLAGLARIVETDVVTASTTRAMYADAAPVEAPSLKASVVERLKTFPLRLTLRSLQVQEATSVGASSQTRSTVFVLATFALPGLETLGLSQEVRVRVGSELN